MSCSIDAFVTDIAYAIGTVGGSVAAGAVPSAGSKFFIGQRMEFEF